MNHKSDICSLHYLVGTLSTNYKGVITSLVIRNFCINNDDGRTVFKGELLYMPPGVYEICLMFSGAELAREGIRNGFFELRTDVGVLDETRNLQLDIVQQGRHIGTFLLQRSYRGGMYVSAMELSEELSAINFKQLESSVQGYDGLKTRADTLIASVLSAKKDWKGLSEDINTFSHNLFWYMRGAFYLWVPLLMRFLRLSCENLQGSERERALSNLLAIIELPLKEEKNDVLLAGAVDIWKGQVSGIEPSLKYRGFIDTIRNIHRRLPEIDIDVLVQQQLSSLKDVSRNSPVLSMDVINYFGSEISEDLLHRFTAAGRAALDMQIQEAEAAIAESRIEEAIARASELDPQALAREKLAAALFAMLSEEAGRLDEGLLAPVMNELASLVAGVDPGERLQFIISYKLLLKKFFELGRTRACAVILETAGNTVIENDVLLNREIASLITKSGDEELADIYMRALIAIHMPPPRIAGFSDVSWAELADPEHYNVLTGFMHIIALDPRRFRGLLIHLVSNVFVSGVFISDDRIFQREVTAYLNAVDMREDFLLHYMLLRRLPVYFNEVGAAGKIREYSTELDSWGNDQVIYFLRKQLHVNASSNNIRLFERVITFWVTGDPEDIAAAVPVSVREAIDPVLSEQYGQVIRALFQGFGVLQDGRIVFRKLLSLSPDQISEGLTNVAGCPDEIRSKIYLACVLYREVVSKYAFHRRAESGDELPHAVMGSTLKMMESLKKTVMSEDRTEAQESFYFKRHIAFGIPSVIGSYHEPKFDALSEILRCEEDFRLLIEDMVVNIESRDDAIVPAEMDKWIAALQHINRFFIFHDLGNPVVSELIEILGSNSLCLSQVIDLLRIWQRELTWMVELLYRTFQGPITGVLSSYRRDELPDDLKELAGRPEGFLVRASDTIIRDMINSIAGFEETDRLLNCLIKRLMVQMKTDGDGMVFGQDEKLLQKPWYLLEDIDSSEIEMLGPVLGGKAKNLVTLKGKGIHIPYGATFSSRLSLAGDKYIESSQFQRDLRTVVSKIENNTGQGFGSAENPLFLSVRSGSYISMPGILSTILYCGINRECVEGFAGTSGDERLAWDSYRRFIEHYASIVHGVSDEDFVNVHKQVLGVGDSADIMSADAGQMRSVAQACNLMLKERGIIIPEDVYEQLRLSIIAVFRTWQGAKAVQFREGMNVSSQWGTSVTLMPMVYGNRIGAGSAVFFTRKPRTLQKGIYGEIREAATGDDIVYGRYMNRAISSDDGSLDSLEVTDKDLFKGYHNLASEIEAAMDGIPQEVETVYVRGSEAAEIFVLQTKRMEFHKGLTKKFHDICKMESSIIGRGIGMHGGALSGTVTFSMDPEYIRNLKLVSEQPVILLRNETSTEDVSVMPAVDGIITATGGATSHAAILSQKFDLVAVVGCTDMIVGEMPDGSPMATIGGYEVKESEHLSIDGSTGLVYSAFCKFTIKEQRY